MKSIVALLVAMGLSFPSFSQKESMLSDIKVSAGYSVLIYQSVFAMDMTGKWNPAAMAAFNLLWGQHTEVITGEGERPSMPVWVAGLRITPLRFELPKGFISVLELGYGLGPYKGNCYELTLINTGARWLFDVRGLNLN
jgi:hypothetical protein